MLVDPLQFKKLGGVVALGNLLIDIQPCCFAEAEGNHPFAPLQEHPPHAHLGQVLHLPVEAARSILDVAAWPDQVLAQQSRVDVRSQDTLLPKELHAVHLWGAAVLLCHFVQCRVGPGLVAAQVLSQLGAEDATAALEKLQELRLVAGDKPRHLVHRVVMDEHVHPIEVEPRLVVGLFLVVEAQFLRNPCNSVNIIPPAEANDVIVGAVCRRNRTQVRVILRLNVCNPYTHLTPRLCGR